MSSGLLCFGLLVGDALGLVLEDVHLPGLTGHQGTAKSGVVIQYTPHDTECPLVEECSDWHAYRQGWLS